MFVKIVLYVVGISSLVHCNLLSKDEIAVLASHNPLFYVSELISDWNEKYSEGNDVVMFNVGEENSLSQNLPALILPTNSFVSVDVANCKMIQERRTAFIIIISDVVRGVGFLFKIFVESKYLHKH